MTEPILLTAASVDIQAAADPRRKPRVEIVAYQGAEMTVAGWGPVVIDLRNLDAAAMVPILADHDATLRGIVGQGSPAIRSGKLLVSGEIADTESARQVVELAKSGFPFQASVGVEPIERRDVRPGETVAVNSRTIKAGPRGLTLVVRSRLREVSITALASDPATSVAIAAKKGRGKMSKKRTGENEEEVRDQSRAALPENQPDLSDPDRVRARWAREKWHDPTGGPHQRAEAAMIRAAAGRIPYADFERVLLEERVNDAELRALYADLPKHPGRSPGTTPRESGPEVLEGAILARLGREGLGEKLLGAQTMQKARDIGAHCLADILRFALQREHREAPRTPDGLIRAAFSTVGLPVALGNTLGKVAMDAYASAPATWRSWCQIRSATSFKDHTGIRLSDALKLEEYAAGGELHHADLQEATYTFKVATYGKIVQISRQDIINDDLGLFDSIPTLFGRSAARKLNDLVYTVLLGNAGSFFSAGNNNYLDGAGSALSITSLASAIQAVRNQTDTDGAPLDLVPRVLLAPPALEPTARQLLNSTEVLRVTTDQLPTGNPLQGLNLALEVEPRIESAAFAGSSETQWYLLCGPADGAMIVAFLNGQQSPTVETVDPGPDVLGSAWRVYMDFGAALADGKAGVKSAGA